jgi:hypothetical protein
MPMSSCEPFAWYVVIRCEHCGTRQPLLRDLSEGKNSINAIYRVCCEKCGHVGHYDSDGEYVERYQHTA